MSFATAALPLLLALPAPPDPAVGFARARDRLLVTIDGEPFATYVWDDPTIRRPYFAHIRTPKGVRVTRNLPPLSGKDAVDHATMHPGLWLAFGDVSGADFWRNKGVVRHAGFVEGPASDARGGRFAVRNVYESGERRICEEVCRIRIEVTPRGYLIDWRSEFRGADPFTFGDQEEMGLGVRMATDLTVPRGGTIRNSEGREDEKGVWGRQADWCDYAGEGGGLLLMPGPDNFGRSWFHARDYGLLVANPFGRRSFTGGEPSRVVVGKGESLTLRFGVLVHDGAADRTAAYRDFLRSPGDRP